MACAGACLVAALAGVDVARARVDAQTFHPVVDGNGWIGTSSSVTLPQGVFGFGAFLNYAMDPIQAEGTVGTGSTGSAVTTDLVTVDLLAAVGILPGWDIGIDVPLSTIRNVAFASDLDQFTFGVGDVRVGTKLTLVERVDRGAGLALRGELTVPSGDTRNFLGEEGVTFTLGAVGETALGPLDAALDVAYLFRDESEGLGDAATLRAALAWPIASLAVTPVLELRGSSTFDGFLSDEEASPLEALVGARWVIGESWFEHAGLANRGLALTTGVGFGLNAGIGSPEIRAVFGISPVVAQTESAAAPSPTLQPEPDVEVQPEPENDRDRDGIPDEEDVCPGLPETRNLYLDDDGCPDAPPHAEVRPRELAPPPSPLAPSAATATAESYPPIHFESSRGTPDADARATIERLSRALRSDRSLRVRLTGHSDASGDARANLALSRERAEQVRRALLDRSNVAPSRILAEGRGDDEPVASNADPAGRARNRRVEIELIRPE
ncbi:MAG: OmpA family protein [bacterium]